MQQSNSFKYKQYEKKINIRFQMYDFDFVLMMYKRKSSSFLQMKNLLFQSKERIFSWTT